MVPLVSPLSKLFQVFSFLLRTYRHSDQNHINSLRSSRRKQAVSMPCHSQAQHARHARFDESRQVFVLNLSGGQQLIHRFSAMRPNQYVRDARSPGESASVRVLPNKLASRSTSRIPLQVGKLSDLEDLAQA